MSNRPATMRDVARRAEVSLSTVSRVLRGAPGVSPRVRDRVETAAAEMHYVVSKSASGLATGRTNRVAAVVNTVDQWYFSAAISGLGEVLQRAGMDLLIYQVGEPCPGLPWLRDLGLSGNCDAIITVSMDISDDDVGLLEQYSKPIVLVGQQMPGHASVFIDDRAAAMTATRHLLNLGHTRIAYIGSRLSTWFHGSSRDRLEGYRNAMAEAGLPEWSIIKSQGHAGGQLGMGELLSNSPPPTAVLAEFDEVAMGAYRTMRRAGTLVPQSISLMGFDNHEVASVLDLTTVDQSPRAIGSTAAQLTLDILAGEQPADTHIEMPVQVVPRHSTAAPDERFTRVLS